MTLPPVGCGSSMPYGSMPSSPVYTPGAQPMPTGAAMAPAYYPQVQTVGYMNYGYPVRPMPYGYAPMGR